MSVVQTPRFKERDGGIPRRKSCMACAKAKRRCDLALPTCSRCSTRQLNCHYPFLNHGHASSGNRSPLDLHSFDGLVSMPMTQQHQQHPLPPPPRFDIYGVDDITLLVPPTFPPLPPDVMSRIGFALTQLLDAPRIMVLENQTAWCHPLLYRNGMPQSMQDAYSCCSLHLTRNAANSATITSIIESRIAGLLASEQPDSPLECLARVQALILYQTIRLFTDDVSCRMAAELAMPSFRLAVAALLRHTCFEDTLSLSDVPRRALIVNRSSSPEENLWYTWIFDESTRRTMLLSNFLTRIWEILRGSQNLQCDHKLGIPHCWYISSQLWQAQSPFEFALAYAQKNLFLVWDLDFTDLLAYAQPDDIDMFGKIMLTGRLGIDAVQGWFSARGAMF
ncbi:hypothetical protein BGW36DRAFT_393360 [Talaromyces proteolyticus]|uniref:Zn(2)-C6 fungal-type domain-containing protein n=1 Tax=Talaromyces proteolyticus TaxID=1131652 RepID=A0AAD4Q6N0_9EURO|nr:uncharacterized protein BGW36DRAFT_393360 [Talaromyces proteolyticus]KAH8705881.1 hypothetical protein BGW36DRAFT_393360 [Talaromyces proteolyticus]